jgi:hypothetical protein
MGVKLQAVSGGSVELVPTNTASNFTATMPAVTGNVVLDSATQTLTNKTINGAVINSMASSVITSGTAVASTSGTSIDFTSIPSWVKRITVMFSGVSTNGSSILEMRIGSASGIESSGYNSIAQGDTSAGYYATSTSGFILGASTPSTSANIVYGTVVLTLIGSNAWTGSGCLYGTNGVFGYTIAGAKSALAAVLDRVRITTTSGTDTFDAGSINILYE